MGLFAENPEQRLNNLNSCIENCKRILADYGSSPIADSALFLQGSAAFFNAKSAQEYDEPVRIFNQYITRVKTNDRKAAGYVSLGYSYENKYFLTDDKELLNQAIQAYEKAIDLGVGHAPGSEAKLCKARLMELQYKDDQAMILYESVKNNRTSKPLVSLPQEVQYGDPQMNFMQIQLKTMQDLFSYSQDAQFAIERLEGQK